jgi:hypothetical protein
MTTPVYPNRISLLDIANEFGGSTPIGVGSYRGGGSFVSAAQKGFPQGISTTIPSSGQISIGNFHGATKLPASITVYVMLVGGGGGGGGGQVDSYGGGGGGGGGGGIRKLQLTAMNSAFAADIIIGQGGSAGQLYSPGGDGTNTVSPEGYSTGTSSLIEKKSTAPIWANGATPVPAGAPSGYNYNVYVGQTNAGFGYAGKGGFVGPSPFGNGGAGGQGGNAGGSRGSPGTSGGSDGVRAGGGGGGSDDTPSLGNGGNGVPWIDGAYYGGGGGGGGDYSLNSTGGLGGGGAGGAQNPGTAGTNGLGGGGGGGGSSNGRTPGGAGGSGCIIFAYTKAYGQLLTGGTVTSDANYYYHKITSPLETFVNNAIAWT